MLYPGEKSQKIMKNKENNLLIARFMGCNMDDKAVVVNNKSYSHEQLRYDISWDWLMEVVDKIQEQVIYINIRHNFCSITAFGYDDEEYTNKPSDRLKHTYYAIIRYINWLNTKAR